ncbi:MAG: cation-transporting P-type ATPase [Gammaproteobacteria bacterium]
MGNPETLDWHAAEAVHVAAHLHLDLARGLDEVEASARLAIHGLNRPTVRCGRGPFLRFLAKSASRSSWS